MLTLPIKRRWFNLILEQDEKFASVAIQIMTNWKIAKKNISYVRIVGKSIIRNRFIANADKR